MLIFVIISCGQCPLVSTDDNIYKMYVIICILLFVLEKYFEDYGQIFMDKKTIV